MYIAILEPYPEIDITHLRYLEKQWHVLIPFWDKYDKSEIDAIIIRSKINVNKELINQHQSLSYIFRVWVWLDNIDLELVKRNNIQIINTPNANSKSTAELTVWGILSLLRKVNIKWKKLDDRFNMMWDQLESKTIWIIGFWNIWKIVYKIINAFWNNKFLVYDPYINIGKKIKNIKFIENIWELFSNSDIITFHVPYNSETKNLLNKESFKLLKNNVFIINTSRWGIINENDLIDFLKHNPKAAAYIDVWVNQNKSPNKLLFDLENCIITPHIWSMTKNSNKLMHMFNF